MICEVHTNLGGFMKKILVLIFALGLVSSVFGQNTTTPVRVSGTEVKKEVVKKDEVKKEKEHKKAKHMKKSKKEEAKV